MFKYLLEKEFKQIVRDKFMPRLMIAFPLMMMVFLPWAADMEIKNVDVVVVDNSGDSYSDRLVETLCASGYFTVVDKVYSYEDAISMVEYGDADIIMEIPVDFEKMLSKGEVPTVLISVNSVNGMKAGLGTTYLNSVIRDYCGRINSETNPLLSASSGINVDYRYNKKMDYKSYMIPALIVLLLTLMCGFLPAMNIVSEKEKGTIEQMNVTPVKRYLFILAKLMPYWIIGFIVLNICFAIAAVVYDLIPVGSVWVMYIFSMIFILGVSGMGLIISNFSDNIQQAMFVMLFFVMIFILMSGIFTPISSMPVWAQVITALNPLTYLNEVMRAIYLKGATFADLLPQFYIISGFTVLLIACAILSYRKRG